ncbi:hypothetical protein EOA60_29950 [Mesorhizobium sp. M1A.F.Ca.IN.020.06.1.1]|uniref:hypothetical protein n=1 Tax=unclassified Mesorhizobium TaxID=325217 RepID=UPI000FCB0FF7|nr:MULTISPECIES: hypothetical protein [unclassified Mesorhizobium]RUV05485.1 hypothetical protein EOA79_12700 [Mesorhizobium sp. M1A.F.Ca.IN.020.03.2.1]RUV83135.1 hypothetical protein EOA51_26175 [Mesorhizobium sp. M1A.F.Ca.IN.020.32.1.1]RUW11760.1 hypothetical protein EOA46_11280 [Mesorhizobium sp. M1A.F.Ca.IN.022.05.2.1]RUW17839.1 hypothetical protein EOA60_29950 [Mesorhizobium sp. M1A.F.Ca.IN.020.06.1.1]RWF75245.1 MAG: hypothetical protein EOQ35_28580 [Mesorhizobium sp.]
MAAFARDAGIWKPIAPKWTRRAGVWQKVRKGFADVAGIWKPVWSSDIAVAYHGAGDPGFTFSGVPLPEVGQQRVMVVAWGQFNGGSFSSGNVMGVALTPLVELGSGQSRAGIAAAVVNTGSSGTASVSLTAGASGGPDLGVFSLLGADITPLTTASDATSPINISLDVADGGVIIGCAMGRGTLTAGNGWAWSELVEDFERDTLSNDYVTGAHKAYASAATGVAITATASGSVADSAGVAVSFKPQP